MKVIVIDNDFPGDDNPYGDHFVYKRLQGYLQVEKRLDILVIRIVKNIPIKSSYIYNGIKVVFSEKKDVYNICQNFYPDVVLIHFFPGYLLKHLISKINVRILVWVHGAEALSWKRRIFNLELKNVIGFAKYIVINTIQLIRFKKLIKISNKKEKDIKFVFVSNWMKTITEEDIGENVSNYYIIPNYIDTDYFCAKAKEDDDTKKILLIRNFDSKKYATDIAFKGLEKLKKTAKNINDYKITIVGKGKYLKKLEPKLKGLNYEIINNYLKHNEILELHKKHGIFLCPTRQDAQGVSMCEAMSSGLVCITSNNTAIPEFISPSSGILTNNHPDEIANAIIYLNENPLIFKRMSKKAREEIREKAGFNSTVLKELELIKGNV
jgi:glycosyltransferase involved in cell wall biosynthesis